MDPALFALMLVWQAAPSAVAPVPSAEKPKLICREGEPETGSHIRAGSRCMTQAEWQAVDDRAQNRVPPSARITKGQGDALTAGSHQRSN